jgi:hypothetical protein
MCAGLLVVGLLIGVLTVACQMDRNEGMLMAAGDYGDIAIVVSDSDLEPMARNFADRINRPVVFVIQEERPFNIDVFQPRQWKVCQGYKNIIFIVRWGDRGPVEREVSRLISKETQRQLSSGQGGMAQLAEPYGRYQMALFFGSSDRNSLASLLNRQSERIANLLEQSNRERIRQRFRHTGLRSDLSERYARKFGFRIDIPKEYKENQVEPKDFPAIEWMRTTPSRGITLAWRTSEDPVAALANREGLLAWRREMGRTVHQEQIEPESLQWSEEEHAGLPGVHLRGAWLSDTFAGGGPFWCYFMADVAGERLYCLDLLVYAPGQPKMPYFREMAAIAETFAAAAPP